MRRSAARVLFFLVLLISLVARDAVYINNVIIPDENVITRTYVIHLLPDVLYRGIVIVRDISRIMIASEIGFIIMVPMISRSKTVAVIFSFSSDLQDQCSV